ncbi:hypothetical protein SAMN05444008_110172 [Cnuella takakiae]|uniref:Uncharacterized protein n=1 Tax=Cnuella takakiae TaxID=1302690 RepID=A0A1M5DCP2_9BACT|nr:hypothetical protein [Cnuella takakiae]OLY94021.1 hypothetical protein BUE76_20620 [Cnuella takakiae]SHF64641.1 hypothetical protein SAMN05444008_110172 [Cnuella takakiae]
MNRWKNPLRMNGAILAGIAFLFLIPGNVNGTDLLFLLGTMMLLLAPVNLVVGMVRNRNKRPDGMAFIISAGLLLLLGFGTCGIGFSSGNFNFH